MCIFIDAMVPHKMQTKSQQKAKTTWTSDPVPCASLDHFTYHPLAILYRQKVLSYLHITPTGAADPWKKYMPWSSRFTGFVLMLMSAKVWSSAVTKSAESWQLVCTIHLSIQLLCYETLCGLLLYGWFAVVPKHFQFVIIPLALNSGIFRSEEI